LGTISRPVPVKLICGFIFSASDAYLRAKLHIERRFGKADLESAPIPFTFTDHYTKEMGSGLTRRFCSFTRLIMPDTLAAVKVWTNDVEKKLSRNGQRMVNLDPGYLDLARLVLASTKDFRHRIYIGRGIHAEITLFFQGKSFRSGELTYPDYRTPEYIGIFNRIRDLYALQIKKRP